MDTGSLPKTAKSAKQLGVRFYYTGRPCKRGHDCERQASDATCVRCKREKGKENADYHRQYYRDRAEVFKARSLENYEKKKKEDPDFQRKRYAGNLEWQIENRRKNRSRRAEQCRKNYRENREKRLDYARQYREINRDSIRAYGERYYADNRDYYFAQAALRRAAKLTRTPSWLTEGDKAKIRKLYRERRRLSELTGITFHVDHVIPLRGARVSGLHVPENLDIIIGADNLAKNNTFLGGG